MLLLLVGVLPLNAFLNSYFPRTHRVIPGHNRTKRVLPSTWSNHFQIQNRQVPSILSMRQLSSSKYSKQKERLTVPKNNLTEEDHLPQYSMILRYSRTHSKIQVRTKNNEFQQGQTNSFRKYSYCGTHASSFGDRWGY